MPGIVGAFLAGLAVNAAVRDRPAADKLESFGNAVFIPAFFFVTGFLIDPLAFARSLTLHLPHAAGIILALLIGKWLAAQMAGTVTPLLLFPGETFTRVPYAPTLEGQYILKNAVIIAAGIVLGAIAKGAKLIHDPEVAQTAKAVEKKKEAAEA